MTPLNPLDSWSQREEQKLREPKSKCFIVGEGANTEYWYFESLALILAKKNKPELIELKPVERTEEDRNQSAPRKLFEHAEKIMEDTDGIYGFDADTDRVVMVYDADVYKGDKTRYLEDLGRFCEKVKVAVTNPSFDLFLLLHAENALEKYVWPNEKRILKNEKAGKHRRFIDTLASDALGINVKTNPDVGLLAERFEEAANREFELNQDPEDAIGLLTSNVGLVLSGIVHDGKDDGAPMPSE